MVVVIAEPHCVSKLLKPGRGLIPECRQEYPTLSEDIDKILSIGYSGRPGPMTFGA